MNKRAGGKFVNVIQLSKKNTLCKEFSMFFSGDMFQ